jgi:hypothetical protein
MRRLWQRLRRAWRRSVQREDELAVEVALLEHDLAERRSAIPEEPLPPMQGSSFGPL